MLIEKPFEHRFKIKFKDPLFSTYLEDRVTKCKYTCKVYYKGNLILEFPVSATTKCVSPDKLNLEVGRKIAECKAKKKGYIIAKDTLIDSKEREYCMELLKFDDYLKNVIIKESNYIKRFNY